ncbi:MAG: hypothetical protein JW946_04500 [Candidatus Omnitrophica bacterium]|nr:hypothetical protein [Candidatus Omnitrophota bacterium]
MISKERVRKIFRHEAPDRIGIFDFFDNLTLVNWEKQQLIKGQEPSDYFSFDLDFRKKNRDKNKFQVVSFNGPFQQLASEKKLQPALIDFIREPKRTGEFFKKSLDNIFSGYTVLKKSGVKPDAVFICEDIAYDNGLYFSIDKYKETLFAFHREISGYFKNEGLFTIFHCDGCVEQLVPFLVKAGFSGAHPLQEMPNPNLIKIKQDFKGAITFIGGISLLRLKGLHEDIYDRVHELKEGADYIFCFDGPIPQDTEFDAYRDIINHVETTGAYSK